MDKNRVVIVEPMKPAREAYIENSLKAEQEVVGGLIEMICPFDDPVAIICNDEGKLNNSAPNRGLYDDEGDLFDVIYGTFMVMYCPPDGDNFGSLPDDLLEKYMKMYKYAEVFMTAKGGVLI